MSTAIAAGPQPDLNIGVYGTTRAGKTRFLYELLASWHRSFRIVERSEQASRFLQEVEPDITAYQHSRGTVSALEGIHVVVQRGGDQPPWALTFRDLRGEFLAQEVDDLGKAGKQAAIPRQVRECNSFVFFFDPTSEDDPDGVEAHYARELRRAGRFIDYVLSQRENRYLPILFVLTRLDRWEKDRAVRERAAGWIQHVNERMRAAYQRVLGQHFPPRLVDIQANTLCISSVRANEVEPVVERLGELVQECEEFQRADTRRLRGVLSALGWTLGVFLLLAAGVFFWMRDYQPPPPTVPGPGGIVRPATPPAEWSPAEVQAQLAELERRLDKHPSGQALPSPEEAADLNEFLRWLPAKLDQTRDAPAFAAVRPAMSAALKRLVEVVQGKLDAPPGEPLATRWQRVVAYLEGVPDAPDQPALEQLRRDAWGLARKLFVQDLAGVLQRYQGGPLDAPKAINEVLTTLRTQEQDVRRARLGGLKAMQALLTEVQTTATWLEIQRDKRAYSGTFRLLPSSRVWGADAVEAERRVTWSSPGHELDYRIALVPTRENASEVSFRTMASEYRVEFGLGGPVLLHLLIWNPGRESWQALHDFDLAAPEYAGPLRVLGLPLLVPGQTKATRKVEWRGYELKFDLTDLPRAPLLLEDAAARSQGTPP